jgi:hypothetical protein
MESIGVNIAVAVITALLTFLVINYFKQAGKITANLTSHDFGETRPGEIQREEKIDLVTKPEELSIMLGVDIHNSSDITKSLRKLRLEFRSRTGKKPLSLPPYVLIPGSESSMPFKKLEVVNLPPKEIMHYDLRCWVKEKEYHELDREIQVYLKARYPDGGDFEARLLTVLRTSLKSRKIINPD